ncbi:hypothetical protein HanRHA438_Chr03g0127821 [Helianthus annuus]|nr:hypothetical protein HanHA300_Chr03g0096901 [Helianthus annuus]KAJ0601309.1 hypothetical protein HanIR_Chr03g0126861 [Helianthus annuus]KAJ0608444.1 hypothetical protein HanHA89_Chr03g0108591 [Helianthus annuus]KAJ0768507.1 hypothetical protein HanLR1_Chr03g0101951 [Helianthus annuus]KAJ0936176.1 hypothetical protein HanRHA438_Chr03g0127821 [Helianthus annuus]
MSTKDAHEESRSLALTPTWSVAIVLTVLVVVSLLVERSIHRLVNRLKKVNRKPLLAAVEKMKEELMLLGFISLLLAATTNGISNICIPSKFYSGGFHPCSKPDNNQQVEDSSKRRLLNELHKKVCKKNYEPFVSDEGLEQLHRFIFVIAITHVTYSCFTMLLAVMKIHSWRKWEDDAQMDRHGVLSEISRNEIMRRQSAILNFHTSSPLVRNGCFTWMVCFFRQFGSSVVRADYLMLREAFIMNHNLTSKYDFHNYMIRSMEEEFQSIVGLSGPLWGWVVAFMLFNVKGSNLYFWISLVPVALVLLLGVKLQHVIATLALESAAITGYFTKARLKPRDELFWFKKPELMLSLIHFILFQNAFELASFFWLWWQFGYNSCFLKQHMMVYIRLILGFAAQFLCSYSTLPLYALATQMGTNYKAALIPQRIRETIQEWRHEAKKRRRKLGIYSDYSTVHTETSTVISLEDFDHQELVSPPTETAPSDDLAVELRPPTVMTSGALLRPSGSVCSSVSPSFLLEVVTRSFSLPARKQ